MPNLWLSLSSGINNYYSKTPEIILMIQKVKTGHQFNRANNKGEGRFSFTFLRREISPATE